MARRKKEERNLTEAEVTRPIPQVASQMSQGTRAARATQASQDDRIVVPLVEESLQVNKEWVEAGAAQIRKSVTATRETVPVDLAHEEVDVQRVTVNRVLAEGESAVARQEGETLVIPVVEEELVVMKRLVVREEVRVTKRRVVAREEVSDTVRREQIHIEGMGNVQSLDR